MQNKYIIFAIAAVALVAAYFFFRKQPTDKGAGDTLARVLEDIGIEKQPDCDCPARQQAMNEAIPYN